MPTKSIFTFKARKLTRIFVSYILAAFSAGLVLGLMDLINSPNLLAPASTWFSIRLIGISAIAITVLAAPAAIIAIITAEYYAIKSWSYYAVFGAGSGLVLFVIFLTQIMTINSLYVALTVLVSGLVAGFVYWHFAGRHAGGWD